MQLELLFEERFDNCLHNKWEFLLIRGMMAVCTSITPNASTSDKGGGITPIILHDLRISLGFPDVSLVSNQGRCCLTSIIKSPNVAVNE